MEPRTLSAVPGVIDALTAGLATPLPAASIIDGPVGRRELKPDAVVIGIGPPTTSVDGQQVRQGLSLRANETFTLHCIASSISGDTNMKAVRDRAYALVAAVEGFLRSDPTLGGAADLVSLGEDLTLMQDQTQDGAVAEVAFDITVKAWL